MMIEPWEIWDTYSGNLVFEGTPAQVDAFLHDLYRAQGTGGLTGLKVGPADESHTVDALVIAEDAGW